MPNPTAETQPTACADLTIQGITFSAPLRYAEGHTCNSAEAALLNVALHDKLRDNFAKRIKHAQQQLPEGRNLNATRVLELRHSFKSYAEGFMLSAATRTDPIERAAQRIARDLTTELLNKKGQKIGDLADGVFDAHVARIAQLPHVRAEATRRVEATKSIASEALDLDF